MIRFHPITAIPLGSLNISVHGLFMALGVLAGWFAARRPVKEKGLDLRILENLLTVALVGGLLGARIGYIVLFGGGMTLFQMFAVWEGGLVSHSGYVFGALACVAYLRWKRQPIAVWADALVPAVVLGWTVGRIGDFLSWGEYGIASELPWAVSAFGTARHPTQIYESLAYLGVFLIPHILGRLDAWQRPGMIAAFSAFGFGLSRFLIDFLRADAVDYRLFSQITSFGLLSFSVIFWLNERVKRQKHR